MDAVARSAANIPRDKFDFRYTPVTNQSFHNVLEKARSADRLTVDDGIELLATGTDINGIDNARKEAVLESADRRRAEDVGEEGTFVANLNNNVTTTCNTGCLSRNFKDRSEQFRTAHEDDHDGTYF